MWQKPTADMLVRGVLVRIHALDSFSTATIIKVRDGQVWLARPYAYAHEHFDSTTPLLGCEVYQVSVESICNPQTGYQVDMGKSGIHKMVT